MNGPQNLHESLKNIYLYVYQALSENLLNCELGA